MRKLEAKANSIVSVTHTRTHSLSTFDFSFV